MLKLKKNSNVLVLAAHPDDETLGCGATLAKLSEEGHNIHLMTFTDGVDSRDEEGTENRNNKLEEISKILGINTFSHGGFPDNSMEIVPLLQLCKYLENNCPFTPDLIFTHHPDCLNIDHEMVYRATLTAFRPQFGFKQSILSYFVPSSTEYKPKANFKGNIYFSLDKKHINKKLTALSVYDKEMRKYPHTRSYLNVTNLMNVWGSEVGLHNTEKFELIRSIV